jgi:hypothetical protein
MKMTISRNFTGVKTAFLGGEVPNSDERGYTGVKPTIPLMYSDECNVVEAGAEYR